MYTYTIYDADPHTSTGTEWHTHTRVSLGARSDSEALRLAKAALAEAATGLDPEEYDIGQALFAVVRDEAQYVGTAEYGITADDLDAA